MPDETYFPLPESPGGWRYLTSPEDVRQVSGMDPVKLKKEFGKHLCFHGAIDIQQTMVTGSPDDVRAEVRNRIDTLGPEGYILSPSHTLQPDTPPENFVAMYEEAISYGKKACG